MVKEEMPNLCSMLWLLHDKGLRMGQIFHIIDHMVKKDGHQLLYISDEEIVDYLIELSKKEDS